MRSFKVGDLLLDRKETPPLFFELLATDGEWFVLKAYRSRNTLSYVNANRLFEYKLATKAEILIYS